jgi:hypothetical protein
MAERFNSHEWPANHSLRDDRPDGRLPEFNVVSSIGPVHSTVSSRR